MDLQAARDHLTDPLTLLCLSPDTREAIRILLENYDGQHSVNLRMEAMIHDIIKDIEGANPL